MPEIQAFRGLRYDLGRVGSLSDVIAPPYDVIDADLQQQLYDRHPGNVVRLILNREQPGDDEHENRYSRAARLLRGWRRDGTLQTEPDPSLYVYHQQFSHGGRAWTRRGFMARVRLERFGEGRIYPHEETHPAAKADRLKLTLATRCNLSQIFGIYPDEDGAQSALEDAIQGSTPLEATDHLGVVHRLWAVSEVQVIGRVASLVSAQPMFVADGHHRYETACNYRDQLAAEGPLDSAHPANFVLTMLIGMDDPGLVVLPTHRLFRGLPAMRSEELASRLQECFEIAPAGEGPEQAEAVWKRIEEQGEQGTLGLYASADRRWLLVRLAEAGRRRLAQAAVDRSPAWRDLGVAVLHRLVIETLLDARDLPKAEYVHQVAEVIHFLREGDAGGKPFPLAALVMPASVEHVREISELGERMPAKSTYFYPKLLSGLVINPLE